MSSRALFGLLVAVYVVFAAWSVPRLTNTVLSDVDLTGWTTPIAARIVHGERLYDDVALPLAPGAPLLLALVQKIQGRALILQELWLVALCRLGMTFFAYALAARLTSRQNAVLAAAATLALLASVPVEVAYTSLAQLTCWASLYTGVLALLATAKEARRRFAITGFVAALGLGFHQLVGAGALLGWLAAFGYCAVTGRLGRDEPRSVARELAAFGLGAAAALLLVVVMALSAGSSFGAFADNAIGDAAVLGGSWQALAKNFAAALALRHQAYPSSLVLTSAAVAVGFAAARRSGLTLDDLVRSGDVRRSFAIATAFAMLAGFGGAAWLLAVRGEPLPLLSAAICGSLGALPAFGLLYAAVFVVANWLAAPRLSAPARGFTHAFNAIVVAAIGASVVSSLAFRIDPDSRYVEHPSLALGVICLFIALDRARIQWLSALAFVAMLATLYGPKLNRALLAKTEAPAAGAWAGMKVSYRGEEMVRAAERVQALATRDQTVLVVPEDAHLTALFDRRRPPLRGAIVFLHTYPERFLDEDLARLRADPPRVIVVHPRRDDEWRNVFAKWVDASAAEDFAGHVVARLLPDLYRLDTTFRTIAFEDMGQLDIWVLREGEARP